MSRPIVVVDPGHGGTSRIGGSSPNNATGPNGLLEKNLTLDLARRLRPLLSKVADVTLTRDSDSNLALSDRARAARDRHADLFLSLHLNGFGDASVDGTEVWVARQANRRSRDFAQTMLTQLAAATGVKDRGVRESDLGVLLPARHDPGTGACLAEVSFLTNPEQARRLSDADYRQQIAQAMATAIERQLAAPAVAQSADAWGGALDGPPPLADWISLEFDGVRKIKGSQEELPFYLTLGGKEDQKAHFVVKVTNRASRDSAMGMNSRLLMAPVLFLKLSKKRSEGKDVWEKVDLEGQKGTQFKRMQQSWTLPAQQSRLLRFAIDAATLKKAYELDTGNPFAQLRFELEASAGPVGGRVRQARQIRFALVKPLELVDGNNPSLVGEVALNDPQYRNEYWEPVWSTEFRDASTKPRTVAFTIESSVTDTDSSETTVQNSVTETKGTQTGIEVNGKVSFLLGNLATLGRQLGLELGVKFSKTWSESIAKQLTNTLRTMRSVAKTTKVSRNLTFEIPPTPAGKTATIYLCPVFRVYKVKAVHFDGPDAAGQATARTEEFVPLLSFSGWKELPVVVEDTQKGAPQKAPAAVRLPTAQSAGTVTFKPEVITVSAKRRAEILKKGGWKQVSIAVTVKNFRGEPLRGHRVFAEFQSPGVATVTEGGDAKGGSISWSDVWLKPEGTVRIIAASTGKPDFAPEGVAHYRLPERGLMKFDAAQEGTEVTVTAENSQEAAERSGVKGSAGVDFEVVQVGLEVSGESERKKGSSRAVSWKVIQPTSTFKLTQL